MCSNAGTTQEEVVGELTRSEEYAFGLLDGVLKFFVSRAKLLTKVDKYPNIQDYRRGVSGELSCVSKLSLSFVLCFAHLLLCLIP